MLREIKTDTYHFFSTVEGNVHGEYKTWHSNGQLNIHSFAVNGIQHGEYLEWYDDGEVYRHCFYVNGKKVSFDEIPYPTTPEDRMFFKLKHDIPLLPMESIC